MAISRTAVIQFSIGNPPDGAWCLPRSSIRNRGQTMPLHRLRDQDIAKLAGALIHLKDLSADPLARACVRVEEAGEDHPGYWIVSRKHL